MQDSELNSEFPSPMSQMCGPQLFPVLGNLANSNKRKKIFSLYAFTSSAGGVLKAFFSPPCWEDGNQKYSFYAFENMWM